MTATTSPDKQVTTSALDAFWFTPLAGLADLEHEVTSLRRRSTTLSIARVISYVAYAWVIASLLILTFGFVLLLLGANPDASLTDWVYRHLADTMEPFRGIFPQQTAPSGSMLDVSVLFAMFVYGLFALGARAVIDSLTYRRNRLDLRIRRDQAVIQRSSATHQADGQWRPPGQSTYVPGQSPTADRDPDGRM